MGHASKTDDDTPPRIRDGLLVLLIVTPLMMVFSLVPLRYVMIDLFGVKTEGHVIDVREFSLGSVKMGTRYYKSAVYVFWGPDGVRIEGENPLATPNPPRVGSRVTVRYLPFWPDINHFGLHHWGYWGFWVLTVLFLGIFWVWCVAVIKTARLIGERFR